MGAAQHHAKEGGLAGVNAGQPEPLFALYSPACLPFLEARLAAGKRSLHGLIETLMERNQFALLPLPAGVAAALVNVNTPEEWQRVFNRDEREQEARSAKANQHEGGVTAGEGLGTSP
jgi:molybdopterin-guanine dinucleotide biosynthesis protein A